MKPALIRGLNLFFAIIFFISAALQYNDPDPLLWIGLYLYAALICLLGLRNRFYPAACLAGIAVYTLYAIYLFFADNGVAAWLADHEAESLVTSMKAEKPWIEITREFFGLFIMIIALAINFAQSKKFR